MTIETAWRAEATDETIRPEDAAAIRALPPRLLRGLVRRRCRADGACAASRSRQARARPGPRPFRDARRDDQGRDGRGDRARRGTRPGPPRSSDPHRHHAACPAGSRARPSIRRSMSSTRSWPGPATAGGSPGRCGDGRMAMVHAPPDGAAPAAPATRPTRPPRASSRAPDTRTSKASRSATAVASVSRSMARATRRSCSCRPGSSSIRGIWKAQIPDFARRHRVIAWDARGNGRSDRPADPSAHGDEAIAARPAGGAGRERDGVGGPRRPVECGRPAGHRRGRASRPGPRARPHRSVRAARRVASRSATSRSRTSSTPRMRWAKQNRHFWRRDFRAFLEFFFGEMFNEPHSTKQIEDARRLWHLDGRRDPRRDDARRRASNGTRSCGCARPCAAPSWSSRETATPSPARLAGSSCPAPSRRRSSNSSKAAGTSQRPRPGPGQPR